MISKVLIANRGEIAVRIIRSCRELNIPAVAIYSEADRTAPHVLMADEATCIGPPPSIDSYLNVDHILEAARSTKADAIHPGYGFLAENAAFAQAVLDAGITWVGPDPQTLELMGDKVSARRLAQESGAPIIPGGVEPTADIKAAEAIASEVGYPILIKAAGGGGGKGMRIVVNPNELPPAFKRARSESASTFADERVYVEKVIEQPHHVEIQVFADRAGNVVSFGERECSVQRRYQKIIEETPSPFITPEVKEELSKLAVIIATACGYTGAGTVEFLVDKNQRFYFLEMNTRLQVEHPITEMVTGFDLVAEQIQVASGKSLTFGQEDIRPRGHALECRIYAEDGFDNFTPSTGRVLELTTPGGVGIRLDHGIREGLEITPHYDPILGKLCTWGRTRREAINRMTRALEELRIVGVRTTVPFCMAVMSHPVFKQGDYCTSFIADYGDDLQTWAANNKDSLDEIAALGAALFSTAEKSKSPDRPDARLSNSAWLRIGREEQISR
ncbi:MAG: acetyl-CoA carboxylase biotin carboxylase subunit [Fidelibacterota bacterium]|nr:MAG: acetyl-CoA carboxylase biotin carboxylase subunit [Candidatus Neomarinimicrobiota bacterium]